MTAPQPSPQAALRVGAAEADITPSALFTNWVTLAPYPGVRDPLSVRVLAVESGGTTALIVAIDLLEIHRSFAGRIRDAVRRDSGIPEDLVLLNASHTHSAPRCPFVPGELVPAQRPKLEALQADPEYGRWCAALEQTVLACTARALADRRPAEAAIGRIFAGDWVYNRRPIQPDGSVTTDFCPQNAHAQSGGRRFGVSDPALTAIRFFDPAGTSIATLLHFACHSVAIYPTDKRISADWPGILRNEAAARGMGLPIFLQGCAGDQVPVRRGPAAAQEMADTLSARLESAAGCASKFAVDPPRTASETVALPLDYPSGTAMDAEVQVLALGPLALVALPGEPLIGLALEIQKRSPFPHTLCLGYSNGHGAAYVPMPEDKARGGYEASPDVSPGKPECATLLVETASRLLDVLGREQLMP